ncbi:MAG: magnesium and cobalt transport protein CorA [Lysobacteraceae bacterium]
MPQRNSVVNCAAYDAKAGRRDISVDEISDVLASPEGFVWLGLHEPDEPLLMALREEFGLHELAIEDAHHAHQRPKIEQYGDSLFLAVHTVQRVNARVVFGETHVFLGKRFLVTVRHGASLSYAAPRARCEREPERLIMGPSYALYAVLDFIVDNYLPIVGEFQQALDDLERDIFDESFKRETIRRLYDLKGDLARLRLAVAPMQDILSQLVRLHPELIHDQSRLYFRDVFDHAVRVNEATDTLREMVGAALSVNLSLVTVAQGEVVKRLAGWAALLAAPTLLTSWYGMNFRGMPELSAPLGYPTLIGVTGLVCLGLFVVLKRAKWL